LNNWRWLWLIESESFAARARIALAGRQSVDRPAASDGIDAGITPVSSGGT
jgi:hypothetical protein